MLDISDHKNIFESWNMKVSEEKYGSIPMNLVVYFLK